MRATVRRPKVRFLRWSALFALCLLGAAPQAFSAEKALEVGQRVPDFTLQSLEGVQTSFEKDIRGKAPLTLLFFMTTACSPCFEELQEIHAFVGRNHGKVDVWCIAVDLRGAQTVGPFQQANRFRVRYLLDPKFTLPRVFGFNYTPSLAIVNANGTLVHRKGGYKPDERLSELIRTFLK